MTYTLDYFVAALQCPHCGTSSPVDDSTNMATYIQDQPELTYLGVGHPLKIETEKMRERGYLTIQTIQSDKPIGILQLWECPTCGQTNWAEILIQNDVIANISAVTLDRVALERDHFIHDESKGLVAALTERSYFDISDEEVVQILKKLL